MFSELYLELLKVTPTTLVFMQDRLLVCLLNKSSLLFLLRGGCHRQVGVVGHVQSLLS